MWSHLRRGGLAFLTFVNTVTVEEADAAARKLANDGAPTPPARVVVEIVEVTVAPICVWILVCALADMPLGDVVIIGASPSARLAWMKGCSWLDLRVSFYETIAAWMMVENGEMAGGWRRLHSQAPTLS